MAKKKLCTNVIIGAIIGGLVALTDRDVRSYVASKAKCCSCSGKKLLKNPSESVRKAKESFEQFSETVSTQADQVLNAIEQVEETVTSIKKKD